MSEASELEILRARVAELEAQLDEGTPHAQEPMSGSAWRALTAGVLIVLACVLAPLSVASVWASAVLSDTDQYVETVAPLAEDPAVQQAIADEVTQAVLENLEVEEVTGELLETLASQEDVPPRVAAALPGLAVPLTNGVEGFVETQVERVLASDQFATVWAEVNRIAHDQVVTLLEGNAGGAVSAQDDTITLNLGPIIAEVKDRLVDQGFSLASNVPEVDRSFVLVESGAVSDAQTFYQVLTTLGVWLPLVALALLAAGVAAARDRRRALLRGALGIAAAMVLLGVVLAVARLWYVGTTPAGVLTEEAAGNVFDTLVRFLRTGVRALGILALLVALAAFLTGPSVTAARSRAALSGGIGRARGGAESAGWNTGRFGTWVWSHKRALWVTTFIAAGLVLMFWTRPSGWVVVATALVVGLVLLVLEFLATPPPMQPAPGPADVVPPAQDPPATVPRQPVPAEYGEPGTGSPEDTAPLPR